MTRMFICISSCICSVCVCACECVVDNRRVCTVGMHNKDTLLYNGCPLGGMFGPFLFLFFVHLLLQFAGEIKYQVMVGEGEWMQRVRGCSGWGEPGVGGWGTRSRGGGVYCSSQTLSPWVSVGPDVLFVSSSPTSPLSFSSPPPSPIPPSLTLTLVSLRSPSGTGISAAAGEGKSATTLR